VREFVRAAAAEMRIELEFRGNGAEEHAVVAKVANADAKIKSGDVIVRIHPQYYRPAEVDTLLGDAKLAREKLGWAPKISFAELVREMAAADLALAGREAGGAIGARHGRHLIDSF
jgi:GDPmannose 4,6-dehydratase